MRTQQVECIVFRKKKYQIQYLLLKRVPEKGGFWQPPCGGVEKEDSSLIDAAYREIQEEAGISKNEVVRIIENVYEFTMNKDYLTGKESAPLTEYVFGFEVKPDIIVRIDGNAYIEHEEFVWVSYEKAIEMLKWDDNKNAFRALHAILAKESYKSKINDS